MCHIYKYAALLVIAKYWEKPQMKMGSFFFARSSAFIALKIVNDKIINYGKST